MGWSFACDPSHDKAARIAEIIKPWGHSSDTQKIESVTLAHSVRGNTLYYVMEQTTTNLQSGEVKSQRFIGVSLLAGGGRQGMGWGSKNMEESMGPNEVNCPLAYLDMVPDPGGYATEWRTRVRAYHAKQKTIRKETPKPGSVIKLSNPLKFRDGETRDTFEIVQMPRRGKMRTFLKSTDGILCRVPGWKGYQFQVIA